MIFFMGNERCLLQKGNTFFLIIAHRAYKPDSVSRNISRLLSFIWFQRHRWNLSTYPCRYLFGED